MFCNGMNYNGNHFNILAPIYLIIALFHIASGYQHISDDNEIKQVPLDPKGDLYEVFKTRLEKFNNEITLNNDSLGDDKTDTSNLVDEKNPSAKECLYDKYKKRVDRINDELSLDDGHTLKRGKKPMRYKATKLRNKFNMANRSGKHKKMKAKFYSKDLQRDLRNVERMPCVAEEENAFEDKDISDLKTENQATFDDEDFSEVIDSDENLEETGQDGQTNMANIQPELLKFQTYVQYHTRADSNKVVRAAKSVDTTAKLISSDLSPSYPSVLTKGLHTDKNPLSNGQSSNLLASIAKKLNTNQLDLSRKLASINDLGSATIENDPHLTKMLQKYISNTVNLDTNERLTKKSPLPDPFIPSMNIYPSNISANQSQCQQQLPAEVISQQRQPPDCGNNITNILEKVLYKLDQIQEDKTNNAGMDENDQPEGAPCDIIGPWNSHMIGLRFDITQAPINPMRRIPMNFNKPRHKRMSRCEDSDMILNIAVHEIFPPRSHGIMNTSWTFTGSAMKQYGGPFFIASKRRTENMLATFAGYCRTCGGMDTVFGSWTYVLPSNDCQDITVSIESKRDIFRRDLLELKRKERIKDFYPGKSKASGNCPSK